MKTPKRNLVEAATRETEHKEDDTEPPAEMAGGREQEGLRNNV